MSSALPPSPTYLELRVASSHPTFLPGPMGNEALLKRPLPCLGMTVEVLGTVIGTAIQGQIVGQAKAPCLQDQNGSAVASEVVNRTQSTASLKETVRPLVGQGFGKTTNGVLCIYSSSSNSSWCLSASGHLVNVNIRPYIYPLYR